VGSDKPSGADNQQERPLAAEWVVGFVDGEGCFSIPIFRNRSCRLGWQAQPEFAVVQGARSNSVLYALQSFFGCGKVTVNRRLDNHRQDMGALASGAWRRFDTALSRFSRRTHSERSKLATSLALQRS